MASTDGTENATDKAERDLLAARSLNHWDALRRLRSVKLSMPPDTQPPARSRFVSRWTFRDKVHIDGDRSIVAVITGFSFTEASMPTARAVWFSNGDSKEGWFEEWRLSEAET